MLSDISKIIDSSLQMELDILVLEERFRTRMLNAPTKRVMTEGVASIEIDEEGCSVKAGDPSSLRPAWFLLVDKAVDVDEKLEGVKTSMKTNMITRLAERRCLWFHLSLA